MKLKKKIAAMGAAVIIMASMSAIGASAYQASYDDSYRIILAYTSYTPSETDSVGTVTNLSTTKTNYSVQSTLYYKTSGRILITSITVMGCCCFQKLTFGQRTIFPSRRSIAFVL